jgi:NTE family protein
VNGRVGLVLGAGGVLGLAYHAGALAALAEATGWDPRTADVIAGTSAGSIAASLLRAGVPAPDLLARATGGSLSAEGRRLLSRPAPAADAAGAGPWPWPRAGSAELLWQALRRPGSVRLGAAIAAALPRGTASTEVFVSGLRGILGDGWPDRPTWLCAVRLDDGARVVFGGPRAPRAVWPDAVAASCAIPSAFRPVEIGGRLYVDGGVHSMTNLDVVAGCGLDLAIVSAPLAMRTAVTLPAPDVPLRLAASARLRGEAAAVGRRGTAVVLLLPSSADRRAMGLDMMDPGRRAAVAEQARSSALEWLRRPEVRRGLDG